MGQMERHPGYCYVAAAAQDIGEDQPALVLKDPVAQLARLDLRYQDEHAPVGNTVC
jgi:hypothetical protein